LQKVRVRGGLVGFALCGAGVGWRRLKILLAGALSWWVPP